MKQLLLISFGLSVLIILSSFSESEEGIKTASIFQNQYANNSTFNPKVDTTTFHFVIAVSGLSLRAEPDSKAKRIHILPYGTPVEILKNTEKRVTIIDEGKTIKGQWVLIKASTTPPVQGYVFDGFLSKTNPRTDLRLTSEDLEFTGVDSENYTTTLSEKISIDLISKRDFLSVKKRYYESQIINDSSGFKKRNGTSFLQTKTGTVKIHDKIEPEDEEMIYTFEGFHKILNSYILRGSGIEELTYTTITRETGKIKEFYSIPIVSADGSKALVMEYDLFEVAPATLIFYDIKNQIFDEKGSYYNRNVIHLPNDVVFWKNSNEVYMKVLSMKLPEVVGANLSSHYYQYIRIKIPD